MPPFIASNPIRGIDKRGMLACLIALATPFWIAIPTHSQPAATGQEVLAYLGSQPITRADVDFQLGRNRSIAADGEIQELPAAVLQSTIDLIAKQRQALQTLRVQKVAVKREEVERWIAEHMQPTATERLDASELIRRHAAKAGISEMALREHVAFRLSWQLYLTQHLTEANVAKHFENQRSRFDGTQFRIAFFAIAVPAGASPQREDAAHRLERLRDELVEADELWNDPHQVVRSQTLESLQGLQESILFTSQTTWIRGTGDQPPGIVSALLKMKPPEVSPPIDAPTAVYLVKLSEVKSGTRELDEVRGEVRAHMLLFLLEFLANQSQSQMPLRAIE
jgi:hypothetical protein